MTNGLKNSAEALDVTLDLKALTWPLIAALICMIMTLVTIHFIKNLCKEIKVCESPFSEGVITNIKRLAYIFRYGAVLQQESDETL